MNTEIRMTGRLAAEIRQDLARPHPFAAERVGFVFGKLGALAGDGRLIILTRYHRIPDEQYEEDETVGARIGREAMQAAMVAVCHGRPARVGLFHVHVHDHSGPTAMSRVDAEGLPPMMPGFQQMGRQAAHGIVILSRDHGSGWVWLPGKAEAVRADTVTVIGAPIGVFQRRGEK